MAEQNWAKEKSKSEEKVEKEAKPDDDEEAFDALEAEQKEFLKVCILSRHAASFTHANQMLRMQKSTASCALSASMPTPSSTYSLVFPTRTSRKSTERNHY